MAFLVLGLVRLVGGPLEGAGSRTGRTGPTRPRFSWTFFFLIASADRIRLSAGFLIAPADTIRKNTRIEALSSAFGHSFLPYNPNFPRKTVSLRKY